jgi:hypothetical protein
VILVCEDRLHEVFVRRFLRHYGIRDLRVPQYPATGRGAGESFVRRTYPNELVAYRRRSAKAKTMLVAVIDADQGTVAEHEEELRRACRETAVEWRKDEELVVHAIPRPAINTWLAYLDGKPGDETQDYKTHGYWFHKCEAEASRLVKRLHGMCTAGELPAQAPPSLKQACVEFARIKDHLR